MLTVVDIQGKMELQMVLLLPFTDRTGWSKVKEIVINVMGDFVHPMADDDVDQQCREGIVHVRSRASTGTAIFIYLYLWPHCLVMGTHGTRMLPVANMPFTQRDDGTGSNKTQYRGAHTRHRQAGVRVYTRMCKSHGRRRWTERKSKRAEAVPVCKRLGRADEWDVGGVYHGILFFRILSLESR